MLRNATYYVLSLLLGVSSLCARNVILEFKGAYFLSTNSSFRDIYGSSGALFGPELTVQLCNEKNWYAFMSVDYLKKKGHTPCLCDPTTVRLIPLAFGLKYFLPAYHEHADFYLGLGFEPANLRTKNCSQGLTTKQSQWGFGGIGKFGAYCYMPCNYVLDIFVDYSFLRVGSNDCVCQGSTCVQSVKANVSGAIFGIGLGYAF